MYTLLIDIQFIIFLFFSLFSFYTTHNTTCHQEHKKMRYIKKGESGTISYFTEIDQIHAQIGLIIVIKCILSKSHNFLFLRVICIEWQDSYWYCVYCIILSTLFLLIKLSLSINLLHNCSFLKKINFLSWHFVSFFLSFVLSANTLFWITIFFPCSFESAFYLKRFPLFSLSNCSQASKWLMEMIV